MRLTAASILILLLFFAATNGVVAQQPCLTIGARILTPKLNATINALCSTTAKSTKNEEFNKNSQSVPSTILPTSSLFSFNSTVEARHFLDAFFISFFTYSTSNSHYAKYTYLDNVIATAKRLKLIYPHHSFW